MSNVPGIQGLAMAHLRKVTPLYLNSGGDYTVKPQDQLIFINTTTAATDLTWPSVAEMEGKVYCVILFDSGSNDVDHVFPDDAPGSSIIEALDMDADGDAILFTVVGGTIFLLSNNIA